VAPQARWKAWWYFPRVAHSGGIVAGGRFVRGRLGGIARGGFSGNPWACALAFGKIPCVAGRAGYVIGYPMGIAGMVAKSPSGIYERLAYRHNDITAASELAALSLIRPQPPSATSAIWWAIS